VHCSTPAAAAAASWPYFWFSQQPAYAAAPQYCICAGCRISHKACECCHLCLLLLLDTGMAPALGHCRAGLRLVCKPTCRCATLHPDRSHNHSCSSRLGSTVCPAKLQLSLRSSGAQTSYSANRQGCHTIQVSVARSSRASTDTQLLPVLCHRCITRCSNRGLGRARSLKMVLSGSCGENRAAWGAP
jgi:hypothetical protein